MGYRGKVAEQRRARELRAQAWTLQGIADELGVARSAVSLWVRDVAFTPVPRRGKVAQRRSPNTLQRRKQAGIEQLRVEVLSRVGKLSDRDLLIAGIALYAGEVRSGTDGSASPTVTPPGGFLLSVAADVLRHR